MTPEHMTPLFSTRKALAEKHGFSLSPQINALIFDAIDWAQRAQPATMFNGLTEAETDATASVFGLVGAQPASPTIQDLAAGAHYPQATGWSNPAPNAAANAGTAASSASVGGAQPASVPAGWPEAYAAFQGAFDNPLQRRLHGDEFASDARARMREFNEAMLAAPAAPQSAQADQAPAEAHGLAELVALELERIANDPPISGNELAQARVPMAAASLRDFGLASGATNVQPNGTAEPDCWAILTPNGSKLVPPDEAKGRKDAYPLYTHSQQPLTEEQIRLERKRIDPMAEDMDAWSFEQGVRFAERALGITKDTK